MRVGECRPVGSAVSAAAQLARVEVRPESGPSRVTAQSHEKNHDRSTAET